MTIFARTPSSRAASATACAWFPEENATTPRARSAGVRRVRRENAPRALKAPTRWKTSHLKKTRQPSRASSCREVKTGVRWTWLAIRSRAARTSARETERERDGGMGVTSVQEVAILSGLHLPFEVEIPWRRA